MINHKNCGDFRREDGLLVETTPALQPMPQSGPQHNCVSASICLLWIQFCKKFSHAVDDDISQAHFLVACKKDVVSADCLSLYMERVLSVNYTKMDLVPCKEEGDA